MSGSFIQYETLALDIVLVDDDDNPIEGILDGVSSVVVSFDQPEVGHIDLTGDDLVLSPSESMVTALMGQEDTALFERAMTGRCCNTLVNVEVNILYESGERRPSYVGYLEVFNNLYRRVMQ